MSFNYTVKQGDHLSKIAKAFGFYDYHVVWDHPQNADLRQLRDSPHVLLPSDVIFIPTRELRIETRSTDARHVFRTKKKTLRLRIVTKDHDFAPLANTPCQLQVEFDSYDLTTDADGLIEKEITSDDENGSVRINLADVPFKIGHLNPVAEITGQQARLNNLGYNAGPVGEELSDKFRSAVEEFQCDHKLAVDGICGPMTQLKLKTVHGC